MTGCYSEVNENSYLQLPKHISSSEHKLHYMASITQPVMNCQLTGVGLGPEGFLQYSSVYALQSYVFTNHWPSGWSSYKHTVVIESQEVSHFMHHVHSIASQPVWIHRKCSYIYCNLTWSTLTPGTPIKGMAMTVTICFFPLVLSSDLFKPGGHIFNSIQVQGHNV